MKMIRAIIRSIIRSTVNSTGKTAVGRFIFDQVLNGAMERIEKVNHRGIDFVFTVPNSLNYFRISTFSSKEPETLEWIDNLPRGCVVWDIGANVGLYSCYAAKARDCRVFAFEPAVFNLELLARNIWLNALTERVTIVPLPLTDVSAVSKLNMTTTDWGGALSTFGQDYGFDGEPLRKVFEFQTLGITINEAAALLGIPQPDFIKIDVDGIEHLILSGGAQVLEGIEGISIEINDAFEEQAKLSEHFLRSAGLQFMYKKHSSMIENSPSGFNQTFNQVWQRLPADIVVAQL
jgi:FkbM family methyltransferase